MLLKADFILQPLLCLVNNYSTFFTMLSGVSVSALAGVASISFVAVPAIETGRGVADRLGLYWKNTKQDLIVFHCIGLLKHEDLVQLQRNQMFFWFFCCFFNSADYRTFDNIKDVHFSQSSLFKLLMFEVQQCRFLLFALQVFVWLQEADISSVTNAEWTDVYIH